MKESKILIVVFEPEFVLNAKYSQLSDYLMDSFLLTVHTYVEPRPNY